MEILDKNYDYCIVGAGVSGLYLAKILSEKGKKILLLDREPRFGGRLFSGVFESNKSLNVPLGGSVVRSNDKRVISLSKKMGMNLNKIKIEDVRYDFDHLGKIEIQRDFLEWKDILTKDALELIRGEYSMEMFLSRYFSNDRVKRWKDNAAYSDFWKADVYDTLAYYPISDMFWFSPSNLVIDGGYEKFIHTLIDDVCDTITAKGGTFMNNSLVQSVLSFENGCHVEWKHLYRDKYKGFVNRVVFATTIGSLKEMEIYPKLNLEREIHSHPFLRIYTLHESLVGVPDIIMSDGPLKKSIVFSRKNGILLGVYCDGELVDFWRNLIGGRKEILLKYLNILYKKHGVPPAKDVTFKLWEEGTHYYLPRDRTKDLENLEREKILEKMIIPSKNIYLCGEMVSINQGWVEGALESVERLIKLIEYL